MRKLDSGALCFAAGRFQAGSLLDGAFPVADDQFTLLQVSILQIIKPLMSLSQCFVEHLFAIFSDVS